MRILFALLFSTLLLSCTSRMKSGSEADKLEPASVRAHGVSIQRVGEEEVNSLTSSLLLSPGPHTIFVSADASNYGMLGDAKKLLELRVKLEEGKNYVITTKRGTNRLCAFEVPVSSSTPDFGSPAGCYQRVGTGQQQDPAY